MKKKLPVIPPLLNDGKLVSDFKEKANKFLNFLVVNVHLLTTVANVQVSLILLLIRDFPQLCLTIKISLRLLEL